MQKKYFYNVDTLRILFAIIIVYYHLCPKLADLFNGANSIIYQNLVDISRDTYHIIACFFIISGFFLYQTFINKKELSWFDFLKSKIARLWPVLAFSIVITIIFFGINIFNAVINIMFLQCIGISFMYKGINWFISPLFWGLLFYFYILKVFSQKHANLIIAICTYFSFVGLINNFNGDFSRETFNCFFSGGMLIALANIGLGYFTGVFYGKIKDSADVCTSKIKRIFDFLFINTIEILCFGFLIYNFIFHKIDYQNKFIFVLVFTVMFLLFLKSKGILSALFNSKWISYCGRYAYSIFVMQQIGFNILKNTLWKIPTFVSNAPLCISVSIAVTIIIGIVTYYAVELPAGKYLKKKFGI
ncbi:acyltransferase [bacterium]|nr:acyltransferase [bacterium]